MRYQFYTLRFTAAQRGAGLAKSQISQTSIAQGLQRAFDFRHATKEIHRFIDGQLQNLRHVLAAILDLQRLGIKTSPAAHFTAHKCRRQKIHFQFDITSSLALRTAALRAIERNPAGGVAAQPSLGHLRKELADLVEESNV